jgi:hypothetical protein
MLYALFSGGGPASPNPAQAMTTATLQSDLKAARATVKSLQFGTEAWESAMAVVRQLVETIDAAKPAEEFCSIDSGIHRTRLLSGRIV